MPIPLMHRFGAEREPVSLLVKILTCGTLVLAATYLGFLYWITGH